MRARRKRRGGAYGCRSRLSCLKGRRPRRKSNAPNGRGWTNRTPYAFAIPQGFGPCCQPFGGTLRSRVVEGSNLARRIWNPTPSQKTTQSWRQRELNPPRVACKASLRPSGTPLVLAVSRPALAPRLCVAFVSVAGCEPAPFRFQAGSSSRLSYTLLGERPESDRLGAVSQTAGSTLRPRPPGKSCSGGWCRSSQGKLQRLASAPAAPDRGSRGRCRPCFLGVRDRYRCRTDPRSKRCSGARRERRICCQFPKPLGVAFASCRDESSSFRGRL